MQLLAQLKMLTINPTVAESLKFKLLYIQKYSSDICTTITGSVT